MKLLPMLLINLACVGVGIGAYDMLKAKDAPSVNEEGEVISGDDLAARVKALEENRPGPLLTAPAPATGLSKEEVMAMIRAHASGNPASTPTSSDTPGERIVDVTRIADDPAEAEVSAFRTMMEKVDAQRRAERDARRVKEQEARLLARIERQKIDLNDNQKDEILKISRAYRTKRNETLRKLRDAGASGRDEYRAALEPLREDLTRSIENVVPGEDATKVVNSLTRPPGFDRGSARRNRNRGG